MLTKRLKGAPLLLHLLHLIGWILTMTSIFTLTNRYVSERLTPILAVVIGINRYLSSEYDDLGGAVADADAFEEFLIEQLKVPQNNILSLRNEEATREAIISSFYWLRDDVTYKRDEASILFYFAGHGAQTTKPEEWDDWVTTTGQIEMLCPSDTGMPSTSCNPGEVPEEVIQGIPDRTISMLLNHISDIKGNNLVGNISYHSLLIKPSHVYIDAHSGLLQLGRNKSWRFGIGDKADL